MKVRIYNNTWSLNHRNIFDGVKGGYTYQGAKPFKTAHFTSALGMIPLSMKGMLKEFFGMNFDV